MASQESGALFDVRPDHFTGQCGDFHVARSGDFAIAESEESRGGLEYFSFFRPFHRVI